MSRRINQWAVRSINGPLLPFSSSPFVIFRPLLPVLPVYHFYHAPVFKGLTILLRYIDQSRHQSIADRLSALFRDGLIIVRSIDECVDFTRFPPAPIFPPPQSPRSPRFPFAPIFRLCPISPIYPIVGIDRDALGLETARRPPPRRALSPPSQRIPIFPTPRPSFSSNAPTCWPLYHFCRTAAPTSFTILPFLPYLLYYWLYRPTQHKQPIDLSISQPRNKSTDRINPPLIVIFFYMFTAVTPLSVLPFLPFRQYCQISAL